MRQIGSLQHERDALRFADYLLTKGITLSIDSEEDGWALWVREEQFLAQAKDELEDFRKDPSHERYRGAGDAAANIRREERRRREEARKNIVSPGSQWKSGGTGAARHAPLMFVLIAACVVLYLLTYDREGQYTSGIRSALFYFNPATTPNDSTFRERSADILQGQIWRLATPALLHGSFMHLAFNMFMFYFFGAQIEHRKGSLWFGAFVVGLAVFSSVAQAYFERNPFLGMSGVVYGLFGYLWMQTAFNPRSGYRLSQFTVFIMLAWFFYCMTPWMENIANAAHGAGLLGGVLAAYVPMMLERAKSK